MERSAASSESFLAHLQPLQAALEAYARRLLHDPNEVEDALQAAIAGAFRDFHRYAVGTNFRAWIFRYVHLEVCNRNRKQLRRHSPLPPDLGEGGVRGSPSEWPAEETWQLVLDEPLFKVLLDDPDLVLEQCEEDLSRAITELAPLERAVFLLRAVGEFKYREIAEILQIPMGTVMGYLSRSRLRLRQQLVRFGEERGYLRAGGREETS